MLANSVMYNNFDSEYYGFAKEMFEDADKLLSVCTLSFVLQYFAFVLQYFDLLYFTLLYVVVYFYADFCFC